MKGTDLVKRAQSALGLSTIYRLGAGAPYTALTPADESGACDCSGFVCWVLGISRHQPTLGFLVRLNGGWVNTDGMVEDSTWPLGFFDRVPGDPEPGDLLVYPSRSYAKLYQDYPKGPTIGHVGIVTGKNRVIHCSAGNYRAKKDAIQETDPSVFTRVPYMRALRYVGVV